MKKAPIFKTAFELLTWSNTSVTEKYDMPFIRNSIRKIYYFLILSIVQNGAQVLYTGVLTSYSMTQACISETMP